MKTSFIQPRVLHELNEGEEYCNECLGTGFLNHLTCLKCKGSGKLDWVEKVTGKKEFGNQYMHTQFVPSMKWYVQHNLNSVNLTISTYDSNYSQLISSSITVNGVNEIIINFDKPI